MSSVRFVQLVQLVQYFYCLCKVCAVCAREPASLALFFAPGVGWIAVGGCGIIPGFLVGAWRVLFLVLRMRVDNVDPDWSICVACDNGCLLG